MLSYSFQSVLRERPVTLNWVILDESHMILKMEIVAQWELCIDVTMFDLP